MKERVIHVHMTASEEVAPVAILVQMAGKYDSKVYIDSGSKHMNCKSIMGMMSLSLSDGDEITLSADGPDEEAAIENIGAFLENE